MTREELCGMISAQVALEAIESAKRIIARNEITENVVLAITRNCPEIRA